MRCKRRHILLQLIVWTMFLMLFGGEWNKAAYRHSHILSSGIVITHAHPYNKGAGDSSIPFHKHNSWTSLLFTMNSFLPMASISINYFVTSATFIDIFAYQEQIISVKFDHRFSERAPPSSYL